MKKRQALFPAVVIIVTAAVGILGYSLEDEQRAEPLRMLYETTAGPVVFDHQLHATSGSYDLECRKCHHLETHLSFEADEGPVVFDHQAHGREGSGMECRECHHLTTHLSFENDRGGVVFDHQTHSTSADYDLGCDDCHHMKEEGKRVAECGSCHKRGSDNNSSFEEDEDAVHKRAIGAKCIECHSEAVEEEQGCVMCHKEKPGPAGSGFPPCRSCHGAGSKFNDLLGADDVHEGAIASNCTGCHKEKVEDDDGCSFCHGQGKPEAKQGEVASCASCHAEGSAYNRVFEAANPIHKQCVGAKCVECHADKVEKKDCKFCHRN